MSKIYIAMILKDSVSINGVENKITLDEGLIGFLPVFAKIEDARKWIEPYGSKAEIVEYGVRKFRNQGKKVRHDRA